MLKFYYKSFCQHTLFTWGPAKLKLLLQLVLGACSQLPQSHMCSGRTKYTVQDELQGDLLKLTTFSVSGDSLHTKLVKAKVRGERHKVNVRRNAVLQKTETFHYLSSRTSCLPSNCQTDFFLINYFNTTPSSPLLAIPPNTAHLLHCSCLL